MNQQMGRLINPDILGDVKIDLMEPLNCRSDVNKKKHYEGMEGCARGCK